MIKREIIKWGYQLGKEAVENQCEIPGDINRDNLEDSIQREWTYLENSWTQTDWWAYEVIPILQQNRNIKQFEEVFDEFITSCYNGFYDSMEELFNAERIGEKKYPVGMEH